MTNEIIQEAINDNTPQMTEDEFDDLVFEFECLINSASEEEFPQLVELWWKLTKIAKVDFDFDLFLSKVPIVPLNRDWDWIKIHIDPLRCASLMALEEGEPFHTHLVCPVASAYAVEYLQKHLPENGVTLWVATIDEELTSHSYIVPGLGDCGDLAFGEKL